MKQREGIKMDRDELACRFLYLHLKEKRRNKR